MTLKLFLAFFKIGLFSFGGGYAMLPFMQKEVIEVHNWMTTTEFLDMLAIAQVTPGPVSINTATFVGYQLKGILGSIVTTTAVVLPSFIIIILISLFFYKFKKSVIVERIFKGLRPIILALIAAATVDIGRGVFIDYKSIIISIIIFYLMVFRKQESILMIILAGVLGVLFY